MRDPLRFLAEASGETLLAVDESRLNVQAQDRAPTQAPTAIAVISLQGPLTARSLSFFGRVIRPGMDAFRAAIAQAAADPNIAAIVIDVDSPGGTVAGTLETANAVRAAAQAKPVIAVADTLAASAAYWIASQASEFVVTPSGEVGSIGVLAVHLDFSAMLEQDGVKATIVRSRPGKADLNPLEPLTDEAREALKASVMEADDTFIKAVAQGRGVTPAVVRESFGQGRTLGAKAALAAGMVDRIATMPEVLSGLIKPRSMAKRRSALAFA